MYIPELYLALIIGGWLIDSAAKKRRKAVGRAAKLAKARSALTPPRPPSPAQDFARAKETIAWLEAEGKDAASLRAQWGTELLAEARAQGRFPLSPAALALQGRPTPKVP